MAKSARASTRKHNHTNLRRRVFAPVEQSRAERLSAKLLELASQPKPERLDDMEVENTAKEGNAHEQHPGEASIEDMEIDGESTSANTATRKPRAKKSTRVQKKRRGKATSKLIFPKFEKGRRATSNKKGKK